MAFVSTPSVALTERVRTLLLRGFSRYSTEKRIEIEIEKDASVPKKKKELNDCREVCMHKPYILFGSLESCRSMSWKKGKSIAIGDIRKWK